ncbi:MAG: class I adenylate-forming enzyme family protein [Thiohalomonadaceae bacterium]
MSLLARLQARVRLQPGAEALVSGTQRMSYGELWEAISRVADGLRGAGVVPGARVGLLLENSPEYVACYYGVHGAGGVVVALNPAARAPEIAGHLRHCGAALLVITPTHPQREAIAETLPDCPLITPELLLGADAHALRCTEPAPDTPAAIIYTSGTTGCPKGVTLSHRNLDSNVQSILAYLGLTTEDAIVNVLPFHYSYGNSVLHTHLAAGARVVLDRSMVYPHGVLEAMASERATGFSGVPSTYAVLLSRTRITDHDLSSVRYLTQAGGAMAPELTRRVRAALPHARLFVMYGQTEATARLAYLPPEHLEEKLGAVGIAIPGVQLDIRDEHGGAVADGVTGEIWARGENIMLGYWNDAAASREVMEHGWLKTGDLAHRDRDGYIYIDGRRSEMIKCGAHRISPLEIEEVITEIPGVEDVACTGIPDELLGQVVKAVIVPRAGWAVTTMDVQRHCRDRLPAYKVPRCVEFAATLPRTASGKVKRFLLNDGGQMQGERDVSTRPEYASR